MNSERIDPIRVSKPAVTNYGRLLEILERNAGEAREPELIERLRAALARLHAATGGADGV
jgi:hypothetical protein